MTARYNPPPNWPVPPEGWSPRPEWAPDPAWGPAPEGWEFWVDDGAPTAYGQPTPYGQAAPYGGSGVGEPQRSGRANPDAWKRTGLVALGLFVIFGALAAALSEINRAEAAGRVFGGALVAFVITALFAWNSRARWGWGRYVVVLLPIYLVLALLSQVGSIR